MARAKHTSPEKDPIDPQIWLAQILRKRFDKIVELYSAPLEDPIDKGVHDMRVLDYESSAARFAISLSSTDKFPLKKLRKDLKSLADLLGEVRDLDVAIDAFTKASKHADSSDIKEGIAEIVKDCETNGGTRTID
jgi:CHAD domain-containing protein